MLDSTVNPRASRSGSVPVNSTDPAISTVENHAAVQVDRYIALPVPIIYHLLQVRATWLRCPKAISLACRM